MAKTKKQTKPKKKTVKKTIKPAKSEDFAKALKKVESQEDTVTSTSSKSASTNSLSSIQEFPKAYLVAGLVVLAGAFIVGFNWWQTTQNVVARVNGQPITRAAYVDQLEKQAGEQVLDQMITEALIAQSAQQAGIVIDESLIDEEIASISAQLTSTGQTLDQALAMRGMSEEDLRFQIKIQKQVEQLAQVDENITDEEIAEYIETNADFLPEDATEKELQEIAREQLINERKQTAIQDFIANLRQNAQIENLLVAPEVPAPQVAPEVTIDEVEGEVESTN